MKEEGEDDVEELKKKLRSYTKEEVTFYEPHFTEQLLLRGGKRGEVIEHLLHAEKLVYAFRERGKHGDVVHILHFSVTKNRTLRLPVIFNPSGKKSLYILTYIMRHRGWEHMKRGREKQ